jgi:2-phosphosulfolactate phosphatase
MAVRVYPVWEMADKDLLQGAAAVVIDVLRATSTIVAGIENGAGSIIPVEDIETASRLVRPAERKTKLLAGEWKGQPVEGFDLFNSPSEFSRERVEGKTIIMTTSNGTRAIVASSKARRLLVCSFNNLSAVCGALSGEKEIAVVCSGNSGRLAAEDLLCAGMLAGRVISKDAPDGQGDATMLALRLARGFDGRIRDFLEECERGRQLLAAGYGSDLDYCSNIDVSAIVPEVRDGRISR